MLTLWYGNAWAGVKSKFNVSACSLGIWTSCSHVPLGIVAKKPFRTSLSDLNYLSIYVCCTMPCIKLRPRSWQRNLLEQAKHEGVEPEPVGIEEGKVSQILDEWVERPGGRSLLTRLLNQCPHTVADLPKEAACVGSQSILQHCVQCRAEMLQYQVANLSTLRWAAQVDL